MNQQTVNRWKSMRTPETRHVEAVLRKKFPSSDAYRYNSASIRVRVVDSRFEGKSIERRDTMVEPLLAQLPQKTQADIINLLTLTPAEKDASSRKHLLNIEFEDPSPSRL